MPEIYSTPSEHFAFFQGFLCSYSDYDLEANHLDHWEPRQLRRFEVGSTSPKLYFIVAEDRRLLLRSAELSLPETAFSIDIVAIKWHSPLFCKAFQPSSSPTLDLCLDVPCHKSYLEHMPF